MHQQLWVCATSPEGAFTFLSPESEEHAAVEWDAPVAIHPGVDAQVLPGNLRSTGARWPFMESHQDGRHSLGCSVCVAIAAVGNPLDRSTDPLEQLGDPSVKREGCRLVSIRAIPQAIYLKLQGGSLAWARLATPGLPLKRPI